MAVIENRADKPRLEWLDYTRLFAALTVVAFHYFYNGIRNGKISSLEPFPEIVRTVCSYGAIGVPLFFAISGFVILSSACNTTPLQFLIARTLRLWPAFVVCMSTTAIVLLIWPSDLMPISWPQYLNNLTMVPEISSPGTPFVDGVYWTLRLEITFYSIVFVILLIGQIRRAQILLEMWIAWQIIALCFPNLGLPLIGYDGFFAGGCAYFLLHKNGPSIRTILDIVACFVLSSFNLVEQKIAGDVWVTAFIFGLFATMTLTPLGSSRLPYAAAIGALTYPLYLLHAHIGYTLLSQFGSREHPYVSVFAVLTIVMALSWSVAIFVERPVQSLRR